ncbi:hypothetical protein [uncultured Arthrobacter sp.]|uniref:hypothetical protein n=1 Tax=uncultured Arthrobacter sp. TaxID=114050 RepID=UPI0028D515E2|nr:hypothetical protein [uncultured Arthrobacter sp.]
MAAPVNYSTKISAAQTVAEMQSLLAQHGARRISVDYEASGMPSSLDFLLATPHGQRGFSLPANVDRMEALLQKEDAAGRLKAGSRAERTSQAQAERVAWRVMKTWLEAQLALVAAGMIDVDQALLAFLQVDAAGRTLYEVYREREATALELTRGDSD